MAKMSLKHVGTETQIIFVCV